MISFSDEYEMKEEIGVGSFSNCNRCVNKKDGRSYAVKVRYVVRSRLCIQGG